MALFTGGSPLFDERSGQMLAAPMKSPPVRTQPGGPQQASAGRANLQGVFDNAMGGSINQFNTSANRLRERIDAATRGQSMQARDRNLGAGMGASSRNAMDQFRVKQAGLSEYSQGLASLADMFEKNRLQGLNVAQDAAGRMVDSEDLWDNLNYNLLNNREGRNSVESIANKDRSSRETLTNKELSLRDTLNNRDNQYGAYNTTIGLGNNKNPYTMSGGGYADGITRGGIMGTDSLNTGGLFGFPTGTLPTYGSGQTGNLQGRRY